MNIYFVDKRLFEIRKFVFDRNYMKMLNCYPANIYFFKNNRNARKSGVLTIKTPERPHWLMSQDQ